MMKKRSLIFCAMIFLLNVSFGATTINRVVAIVNDNVITQTQLDQHVAVMKGQMKQAKYKLPSEAVLKRQVLGHMIDQLLQVQMAKMSGIRISNDELNAHLKGVAKQNHATIDQLYQSVQHDDGWTIAAFRDEIRDELLVKKFQEREVVSHISISKQEVNDFLNTAIGRSPYEYHLQRVVIKVPESPTPEQIKQAQETTMKIVKKLKSGADFGKLAASQSSGDSALKGGDMGWVQLASLPLTAANAVKKMPVNSLAGPLQTTNGFEIYRLLQKRKVASSGKTAKMGAMQRRQIEQLIFQRKVQEGIQNLINTLHGSAYIKILNK